MKILAMADLHGHLPDIEAYLDDTDVVLLAGDIAPDRSCLTIVNTEFQTQWLNTKFYEWTKKLRKPVYGCYGNHDYGTLTKEDPQIQIYANAIIDNYLLFAWTPTFGTWNFMVKDLRGDRSSNKQKGSVESRLEDIIAKQEKDFGRIPDIWVCHGPPFEENTLYGSRALCEAILKHQPKIVFVGHIHHGERIREIGNTRIYNCSVTDDAYDLVREPVYIDFRT